ncbi:MAG: OmpA family protein [Pedobacter sp.]
MKITIKYVVIVLTLLGSFITQGYTQTQNGNAIREATAEFKSLKYVSAISLFTEILAKDSTNISAQDMLAYSYKMVKNYDGALKWYEKLSSQKTVKPEWALSYAEVLANKQRYEASEKWYRKYLSLVPVDKRASAFVRTNIGNLIKNPGLWKVSYLNINSQGSDYSPIFYKEGLMFSSNRLAPKSPRGTFLWNNTPFSNLFTVLLKDVNTIDPDSLLQQAQNSTSKRLRRNDDDTPPTSNDTKTLNQYTSSLQRDTIAVLLADKVNLKLLRGNVNTKVHEGPAAVFPNGSLIFTRNNYVGGSARISKDGINKLKLYTAFGNNLSKVLEFPYNSNEYSNGHPSLSKDGNILIFASDKPGGYGGTDLYYCVRSGNGQWTRPINMGKQINTEGNEVFPNLEKDNNLIFASTGHPGLGGLDLFEVRLKDLRPISAVRNLGAPVNSSTDDFGLVRSNDNRTGYFSSNRRGDDDIYLFKRITNTIVLEGTVTDRNTRLPLAGSRILLKHLDGTDTIRTNAKGEFRREMPRETDYETTAQKQGYINEIGFVTSVGVDKDTVLRLDLKLNKTGTPQKFILKNCDSLKMLFAVQNVYYDLDKSDIRPDARPALNELVALMKKHPEITIITSSHCDSRATNEYNKNLSLRRAEASKSYLIAKGISPSRVKVEYFGKTRLVNRCFDDVPCSEEDQQMNRRTEFDVILNGVNITRQNCEEQ